ncbi:MAG: M14 family metallopeptidase, partial [Sedimentisphaerales bacterium]
MLRSVFRLAVLLILMGFTVVHAAEYQDNRSLGRQLTALAEQNPEVMRITDIARSMGKRKVWLVEAGRGADQDRRTRPAMLVVAGIEGNDLIGSSVAASWLGQLIERYGSDDEVTRLLETTTIYLFPRLNPDAAESFFAQPQRETSSNGKPVDDDHDGLVDEDGPEDLNGDGLITWMRVEDPEGQYILDPKDNRLPLKADDLKGEVGAWRYLVEGIDNDHDERWNEDGPGGVNFNRNFPRDYDFFAPDSGVYQVSETETRALAEFVVGHPNIGIIVTYGAADNLLKTPEGARPEGRREPLKAIDEEDVGYYKVMGELYRGALGLDKELEGASEHGTFSDWMYYQRGR